MSILFTSMSKITGIKTVWQDPRLINKNNNTTDTNVNKNVGKTKLQENFWAKSSRFTNKIKCFLVKF